MEPNTQQRLRPLKSYQSIDIRLPVETDHESGDNSQSEISPLLNLSKSIAPHVRPTPYQVEDVPPQFLGGVSTGRFWFIFSQILAVQFIGFFDTTIMFSSHPVITSYFSAANSAPWLSTAFMLTSTAFQPLLGRLSDAVGRRSLFLATVTIFFMGTLWCTLAESIESFIAARAICGIGARGSALLGNIMTSDLVPVERRGTYLSYVNIVFGIGSALGAAFGGAMAETLGWRWAFGVQLPPLMLCLGIAAVAIPDDVGIVDERKDVVMVIREFDSKGSFLLTLAVSTLIFGLNLSGNAVPWSHPYVVVSLAVSVVCFPTFILVEYHAPKPVMPLRLIFGIPRANLIFSNFIGALLYSAVLFNVPLYFQAVLLTSATSSGHHLVLPTLISSATGVMTGFSITRTRHLKWPLICGTTLYVCGSIGLFRLQRNLADAQYLLALVPYSIGNGFQYPATFMALLATSTQAEQAVITSTLMLWRSLGVVLGVAASSVVVQNALVHYLKAFVRGERKDEIMACARASIEVISKLDEPYREQVVRSYEAALRLMFGCSIVVAAVSALLIMPVNLPRLPSRLK